jgi:hypothetical protein
MNNNATAMTAPAIIWSENMTRHVISVSYFWSRP